MGSFPLVKPKKLERLLIKHGFQARHGRGSHVVFTHADGRRTVIPNHNKPLKIGTLKAILRQTDIPEDELRKK